MKEFLLVVALLLANLYHYVENEGTIIYEQKVNLHRRIPADDLQTRQFVPEFQTSKVQLLFKGVESLFKNVEEEEEDDTFEGGGVRIQMRRPETIIYRHFGNNKRIEQREFLGKNYLIEANITQIPWKITGESKKILGYNCMKAMYKDTVQNRNVVAWFSDAIPCPSGPEAFGSLPGMILEVDINEGEIVYNAIKVDDKAVSMKDLKAPDSGKKVTESEFKALVDEHMKKMGIEGGSGGGIRVIRN